MAQRGLRRAGQDTAWSARTRVRPRRRRTTSMRSTARRAPRERRADAANDARNSTERKTPGRHGDGRCFTTPKNSVGTAGSILTDAEQGQSEHDSSMSRADQRERRDAERRGSAPEHDGNDAPRLLADHRGETTATGGSWRRQPRRCPAPGLRGPSANPRAGAPSTRPAPARRPEYRRSMEPAAPGSRRSSTTRRRSTDQRRGPDRYRST